MLWVVTDMYIHVLGLHFKSLEVHEGTIRFTVSAGLRPQAHSVSAVQP